MSYCRFGPKSDLYAYEGEHGYVLHVARSRFAEPDKIPDIDYGHGTKRFSRSYAKHMAALKVAERTPIGLPFDGQSLVFGDLNDMLESILLMRKIGYRIQEEALHGIREEVEQEASLGPDRETPLCGDGQYAGIDPSRTGRIDAGGTYVKGPEICEGTWDAGVLGLPGDPAAPDAPLPRSKCH